jgi:RNA polymerase sigma factor (sigma-70 family)
MANVRPAQPMRDGAVTLILNGAGRQPIPTRAEQLHLARLIQQGRAEGASRSQSRAGHRACQRLMSGNIRLAVTIARSFMPRLGKGSSLEFADLIQEAIIGLHTATQRFDPERGCSFSTYAVWWCRQSVHRLIQGQAHTIRLPAHVQDMERRWHLRPPGQCLDQFCAQWHTSPEAMRSVLTLVHQARTRSIDAAGGDQEREGLGLAERLSGTASDPLEALERSLLLDRLAASLPEELALMERHVVKHHTTKAMAAESSISATAMGRRLNRARRKLRDALELDDEA